MPYFTPETEKDYGRSTEDLAIMNRRYDSLIEDIEPVNPDEGQTEETRSEEIQALIDEIRDGIDSASDEERAFLSYLIDCENDKTAWFDDFRDNGYHFYGQGTVIKQGSAEYAIIPEDDIDNAFKEYAEQYADDCILPTMPQETRRYFDMEAFIEDLQVDGYGVMSSYDGNYEEITVDGKTWYVFRLN